MNYIYKAPKNKIIKFFLSALRHARRLFYMKFRKEFLRESIAKRKGECKQCGCCEDRATKCPHFKEDVRKCDLYPDFPPACKIYPFDEKDKNWFSREHCGFFWED